MAPLHCSFLNGIPSRFMTMTGGTRIRSVEPGRKAGTDRRNTVVSTVLSELLKGAQDA
jgi:hypothetical protein